MSISPPPHNIHFGGPDCPPRALRNLLQQRVDAVPPGGWIRWATYYFRDEALAHALCAAHARGVDVGLAVEGQPRRKGANDAVLAILRAGLPQEALAIHRPGPGPLGKIHPHLHSKIYAFSGPSPHVLIGSFNPSGNDPEDPDVIAEIGDQDRGHNLLVELADPALVAGLRGQVEALTGWRGGMVGRFLPGQNRVLTGEATRAWFFPRLDTSVLDREFTAGPGDRVRGAISHLKTGQLALKLQAAARAGAQVELLVHDTERRVPEATVAALAASGIAIRRYRHPQGLPLHAKFVIVERPGQARAWFGSFNFNPRSRWLNHEVLLASDDPALVAALNARFDAIAAEAARYSAV